MPRTRPELERAEKENAILAAAEHQLETGGYAALSVAGIARELGLAQNAVYWYFPSKDHLFVAAVERMGVRVFEAKHRTRGDWTARLLAVVDALADLYPLLPAIRERAAVSPVVRQFERALLSQFRAMLAAALTADLRPTDAEMAAETVLSTVIGTYATGLSRARRTAVLRHLMERLQTPPA
ncbi:MAG: regulatory protein TetR [Acidimicrobiales bacterium]|nr:regulatory protein TetR [Acidimicrobiales bacterium]